MSLYEDQDPSNLGRDVPREPIGGALGDIVEQQRQLEITQQTAEILEGLRLSAETLFELSSNLSEQFGGMAEALGRSAKNIDQMLDSSRDLNQEGERANLLSERRAKLTEQEHGWAQKIAAARKRADDIMSRGSDSLRSELRSVGMFERGAYRIGSRPEGMREEEFQRQLRDDPNFRAEVQSQLANKIALGQRRDDQTFNIGQVIRALAGGHIGAAIGELAQRLPGRFTERVLSSTERRSQNMVDRGGLLGLRALVGRQLPTLASFLMSPASVVLGQQIAARSVGAYQRDLRAGMQTGLEGTAAVREVVGGNLRARVQGLNPFDALTQDMAKQIADGIRDQGFQGELRAAWQESVGDLVKQTGMSASQALEAMNVSVNQLGQTFDEFNESMSALQETAKATDLSVATILKTMQDFQTAAMQRGGPAAVQAAGPVAEAIAVALPDLTRRGEQSAIIQGMPTLAPFFAGISPMEAMSKEALNQLPRILDNLAALMRDQQHSLGLDGQDDLFAQIAVNSGMLQQMLPGITVDGFLEIMKKANPKGSHGRGFEIARAQQAQRDARAAQHPHRRGGVFGFVTGRVADSLMDSARAGAELWQMGNRPLIPGAHQWLTGSVDTSASQQNWIRKMREELVAQGFSEDQRRELLAEVRRDKGEDSGTFKADERRLENRAREMITSGEIGVNVNVELGPSAKGYFADPGAAIRYREYLRGGRGSQTTSRPPGG